MQQSRAGIARVDADSLGAIREAPSDTARFSAAAVAIEPGAFYVLRTRRDACLGFGAGVRYAKLHALALDAVAGTYRFAVAVDRSTRLVTQFVTQKLPRPS